MMSRTGENAVRTASQYRRIAAECLELGPNVSPDLRGIFVALAQEWVKLADRLDGVPADDMSGDPAPPEEAPPSRLKLLI